ncbi:MAG: LuxR C-terminal-related transcriptional regulator [Actinomycetota bacterium]|nr:LuxR C-terminal-related transcriptional regulator [Actinomycetota bacterium]
MRSALCLLEEAGPKEEALRRTALNADAQLACLGGDPSRLDEVGAAAYAEMAQQHRCCGWSRDVVFAYFNLAKLFERFDECRSMAATLIEAAEAHLAAGRPLVPMPLAEAETLLAHGRFLRCSRQPGRARGILHRAMVVLEPTGAGRLQALLRGELAAAGGRSRRLRPAGELTEKESEVAQLAAQGLTNAQIARLLFLSAKTVDNHLSRVYAKLGISSRRELMLGVGTIRTSERRSTCGRTVC